MYNPGAPVHTRTSTRMSTSAPEEVRPKRYRRGDEGLIDRVIDMIRSGSMPFVTFGWVLFADGRCRYLAPFIGELAINTGVTVNTWDHPRLTIMTPNLDFVRLQDGTSFKFDAVATREGRDALFPVLSPELMGPRRRMQLDEIFIPREQALQELRAYIDPDLEPIASIVADVLPVADLPDLVSSYTCLGSMPPGLFHLMGLMQNPRFA